MRLVFLGTADFSVPSLRAIGDAGHEVAAVVTQPDRPGDRGRAAPRPVADAAEELGLPVLRPPRLRAPEAVDAVLAHRPEALVVAAYGQILPLALLEDAPLGGVNVHASLLPRWRGASPVAAAILHGDGESGVSIMRMDAGLDTGPVFATASTPIAERETAPELGARLARIGAELLVRVLATLEAGTVTATPQADELATLAPRLRREDGEVGWWGDADAVGIDRRVRALTPWPGVRGSIGGERVGILSGFPLIGVEAAAGSLLRVERGAIAVACRSGALRLDSVQAPGGRPMDGAAYLRGRRIAATAVVGT